MLGWGSTEPTFQCSPEWDSREHLVLCISTFAPYWWTETVQRTSYLKHTRHLNATSTFSTSLPHWCSLLGCPFLSSHHSRQLVHNLFSSPPPTTCNAPTSNSTALPRVRALLPDICLLQSGSGGGLVSTATKSSSPILPFFPPSSVVLPLVMAHGQTDRGWTVFVAARLSRGLTLQMKARTYKWKAGIAFQWLLHCRIPSVLFKHPKCTIPFCSPPTNIKILVHVKDICWTNVLWSTLHCWENGDETFSPIHVLSSLSTVIKNHTLFLAKE